MSDVQALSTWITCDGIEACRRGCGGHGYSLLSGLPTLYASYVQNATWEGDNNVLCLQVQLSTVVRLLYSPACCFCIQRLVSCISLTPGSAIYPPTAV